MDENMESLSEMRFLELCYSIIPRLWKFSLTSWTFLHEKAGKMMAAADWYIYIYLCRHSGYRISILR